MFIIYSLKKLAGLAWFAFILPLVYKIHLDITNIFVFHAVAYLIQI